MEKFTNDLKLLEQQLWSCTLLVVAKRNERYHTRIFLYMRRHSNVSRAVHGAFVAALLSRDANASTVCEPLRSFTIRVESVASQSASQVSESLDDSTYGLNNSRPDSGYIVIRNTALK